MNARMINDAIVHSQNDLTLNVTKPTSEIIVENAKSKCFAYDFAYLP